MVRFSFTCPERRSPTVVIVVILCLTAVLMTLATPQALAANEDVPSATSLFSRSAEQAAQLERFSAVWRMAMTLTPGSALSADRPIVGPEPFETEMYLWRKGNNYRQEVRLPEGVLAPGGPSDVSLPGNIPACLVTIIREDEQRLYCQGLDGGWQRHGLELFEDIGADIPFALAPTPEELGLTITEVAAGTWNGRDVWRIEGNMDEHGVMAELPMPGETSVTYWVDQESALLLAGESRIVWSEEMTGGVFEGFVVHMELVHYDVDEDIPDELFEPPAGF